MFSLKYKKILKIIKKRFSKAEVCLHLSLGEGADVTITLTGKLDKCQFAV
jgi:hypothetical protein